MTKKKQGPNTPQGVPYVAGLDELALRLQVPPVQGHNYGIALTGQSGRVYDVIAILANTIEFTAAAIQYMASIAGQFREEAPEDEPDEESRQPEKTYHTEGDSKSDKS